jgi:hypothetical protein
VLAVVAPSSQTVGSLLRTPWHQPKNDILGNMYH